MNFREAVKRERILLRAEGPGGRTVPLTIKKRGRWLCHVGGPVSTRVPIQVAVVLTGLGTKQYQKTFDALMRHARDGARMIVGWGYLRVTVCHPHLPDEVFEQPTLDEALGSMGLFAGTEGKT
jgi:hypothetical protein